MGGNLEKGDEGGKSGFAGAVEGFMEANGLSEGFSSAAAIVGGMADVDVVAENPANGFTGGTEVVLVAVVVTEPVKVERGGDWKDEVVLVVCIPENNPPGAADRGAALLCCPNAAKRRLPPAPPFTPFYPLISIPRRRKGKNIHSHY